jgi:transcriptional regulator with XRE-family HTH domain
MKRDREAIRRLLEQTRQDDPETGLSFPEWLQGQIKQRGWARWRTAEALGVSQRTLSRWLAGTLTPRRRDLDRLAQVFGELPRSLRRANASAPFDAPRRGVGW